MNQMPHPHHPGRGSETDVAPDVQSPLQRLRRLARGSEGTGPLAPQGARIAGPQRGTPTRPGERRVHRRLAIPARPLMTLRVTEAGRGVRIVHMRLLDLSAGGLRLASDSIVLPQSRLLIEFSLDSTMPTLSTALVVLDCRRHSWRVATSEPTNGEPTVAGIYHIRATFTTISAAERAQLSAYVERQYLA